MENLLKEGKIDQFRNVLQAEVFTNMENGQANRLLCQLAQINEGDVKANESLPIVELYNTGRYGDTVVEAVSLQTDKKEYTTLDKLSDTFRVNFPNYHDAAEAIETAAAQHRYNLTGEKELLRVSNLRDINESDFRKMEPKCDEGH
jgi:hypothetical protein